MGTWFMSNSTYRKVLFQERLEKRIKENSWEFKKKAEATELRDIVDGKNKDFYYWQERVHALTYKVLKGGYSLDDLEYLRERIEAIREDKPLLGEEIDGLCKLIKTVKVISIRGVKKGEVAKKACSESLQDITDMKSPWFKTYESMVEGVEFKIKSGGYGCEELDSAWRSLREVAVKKPEMSKRVSDVMYRLEAAKERKAVDYSLKEEARKNRVNWHFGRGKTGSLKVADIMLERGVNLECKFGLLNERIDNIEKGEVSAIMDFAKRNYKNCNNCYEGLMARRVYSKAKGRYSEMITQESESVEVKEGLFSKVKNYFGSLFKPVGGLESGGEVVYSS
ncbi:MAG: hypothetical protein ABIE22_00590 [archaeon]